MMFGSNAGRTVVDNMTGWYGTQKTISLFSYNVSLIYSMTGWSQKTISYILNHRPARREVGGVAVVVEVGVWGVG